MRFTGIIEKYWKYYIFDARLLTRIVLLFSRIICSCAEEAVNRKYKAFGVGFWGECWGFESHEEAQKQSKSKECTNIKYESCTDTDELCSGGDVSSFLFLL